MHVEECILRCIEENPCTSICRIQAAEHMARKTICVGSPRVPSCGTNSCTVWMWQGYNCRSCNVWYTEVWEVPLPAARRLVLTVGCLSVTYIICCPIHTLRTECGRPNPTAFCKIFLYVRVGSQHIGNVTIWHSVSRVFFSVSSNTWPAHKADNLTAICEPTV
jgi:hypothetical protein